MGAFFSDAIRSLKDFWIIVVDVWTHGAWGINIGQLLAAFLTFLIFVALRRPFTRLLLSRLQMLSHRSRYRVPSQAIDALEPPVRFVPVVIGTFFALQFLNLEGGLELISNRIVRSLVAFVIFWGLYNLVDAFSFLLSRLEEIFSYIMVEWLVKAIRVGIILIGGATILDIWGIQVGAVLAGLGLVGVAVALGAQDLFKNLIGGILIIAEKRFNHGDWINIEGVVEGVVESIGFRSTVIRRFDQAPVFVPNARFSDGAVINFSQMRYRRIFWKIGVLYSTSVDQLRQIRDGIETYILDHKDEFANPSEVATFVRVDSFNESSIDIMVYCFTRTTNWGEWLAIKEQLAYYIKDVVEGAGSAFAFPSRSLYIESQTGEKPDLFVPPKQRAAQPKPLHADVSGS